MPRCVLSLLLYYTHDAMVGFAVALEIGILKELYDAATEEDLDWKDLAADAVGAVFGAVLTGLGV